MKRSLEDWLQHLESLHPRGQEGIELGLQRVQQVKARLGQTQPCPVITVGGTNGKGSVCAMLERILLAAGYRVAVYASPHLLRYNERVRLNAQAVDDDTLCQAFARVEQARGDTAFTYFEFGTLAAWEIFSRATPQVIILEVGLGGRLDACNIYDADCAVITNIALDHVDYLGETREAIASEKIGIARPGRPLICGDQDPPRSLLQACQTQGIELRRIGKDFDFRRQDGQWQYWANAGRKLAGLAYPALRGLCQLNNASCALAVLDALHGQLPVAVQDIRRGLAELEVPGRFQVLPGRPQLILDVAHNPAAVAMLAANLENMPPAAKTWAIFGMLADKDIAGALAAISEQVDFWLPCDLPGSRAMPAALLAEMVREHAAGEVLQTFPTASAALAWLQEKAGADDRILAFGSFLTVADVMRFLARRI